jgi:hypothetical protein
VPTRPKNREEDVIWFDKFDWPWVAHFCPEHPGLAGIADISPKNLSDQSIRLKLSEPFRLVIIICVEDRRNQLYIVALKSVLGEKLCYFFRGDEKPRWGDLAALCGNGVEQRLLTNSGHILNFDGQADPCLLDLSWHAGSTMQECSACRRVLNRGLQ